MSKEEKKKMMEEMMSKMMEGTNPKEMMDTMHSLMPKMMEHFLS